MVRGSCLCGGVRFEIQKPAGPFEFCHCNRCRKVTGSAFYPGIYVNRADFRLVQGEELVKYFEAPILRSPPPYRSCFCGQCGSPIPDLKRESEQIEVPAGLLDDEPAVRPDKHIFVEFRAKWFQITDDLPQLDRAELIKCREATMKKIVSSQPDEAIHEIVHRETRAWDTLDVELC